MRLCQHVADRGNSGAIAHETGYAITDDHPGTVVLHGHGFSVVNYARITWARHAQSLIYWGDIDAPGLQFVNDLRESRPRSPDDPNRHRHP